MPAADTPYIIGVIREKEKAFLQEDEYTRLLEAPTPADSVRSLVDTVYGVYLEQQGGDVRRALTAHLEQELAWLKEVVDDARVLQFLTARYDGLNIAGALIDLAAGREGISSFSPLGSMSAELLANVLWQDRRAMEAMPSLWAEFMKKELARLDTNERFSKTELLVRTKEQVAKVLQAAAKTPLTKEVARLYRLHLNLDESWRTEAIDTKAGEEVERPSLLPEEAVAALRAQQNGTAYELAWDEALLELLRPLKYAPVGYDPVVAYFLAKELEVKTLRLLLSGKLSGVPTQQLKDVRRSLYLAS